MKNNSDKLILIVDDSKDNQELLKIILLSKGFKVHCASNGQEALALLLELSTLPDLILLDAQMPVMNGYEFRVQQSQLEKIKDIPVLVMTGDSDKSMSHDMNAPCGVLVKPLRVNTILETISMCI